MRLTLFCPKRKMENELRLLTRLKSKNSNAINQAIDMYTPYVCTVIYNIAGSKLPAEDIEEIVSDVFVRLWRNAEYIDLKKGTIRSYIAAVARNITLKRIAKGGGKDFVCLDDVELTDNVDFAEENARKSVLWDTVMSLGEPDNEIFVRYYKFNEKLKDIAKITGLNLSTVKSKLLRGKNKLKKILSDAEEL